MTTRDFKSLEVWRRSHALALGVYRATSGFPAAERFGLTSQMRRAVVSIPANIAEGCGRGGDAELARFLRIALGSASELEYHFLLARDLGYMDGESGRNCQAEVVEIKKMLSGFVGAINRRRSSTETIH